MDANFAVRLLAHILNYRCVVQESVSPRRALDNLIYVPDTEAPIEESPVPHAIGNCAHVELGPGA